MFYKSDLIYILVFLISIPIFCLIISVRLILLHIAFKLILLLTIFDFIFCITGKFVFENKILDYTSYNIFLYGLVFFIIIISSLFIDTNHIYGQISFTGAYLFIKVNNFFYFYK
jgi:hypothetical protein